MTLLPALLAAALATPAEAEQTRLQAHFAGALAMLRAADVTHLSPDRRAARQARIEDLAAYAQAGLFPRNTGFNDRLMPYFIDDDGTYCAMAWMLASDGDDEAAHTLAATDVNVYVGDLATDPVLGDWLDRNGITLQEAVRIQPSYSATAADCVCDVIDFGICDARGCQDRPPRLSDFEGCAEHWPGYPHSKAPRLTQPLLDRLLSRVPREFDCQSVLIEDDVRWAYEYARWGDDGCATAPGPGGLGGLAILALALRRRTRSRQSSARPKSTSATES